METINTINSMNTIKNTINIDSLAYGGYGVGRINSKVIFVSYAVPGDILEIEIFDDRKNFAFGRILRIITPSPKRIEPICPHFGICGGCNYLNMPYEEEIYWKTEIFKTEFKKSTRDTADIQSVIAADAVNRSENMNYLNYSLKPAVECHFATLSENTNYLNYRQKISLKIKSPYIGFYKKLSHDVVDIAHCSLASTGINELLKKVRDLLLSKNYKAPVLNNLTSVTLSDAGLKNIIFEFKNNIKNNILKYFAEDALNNAEADNIFFKFPARKIVKYSGGNDGGDIRKNSKNNTQIPASAPHSENYFVLKDKKFSYDLPSFIQINKGQNENMLGIITNYIKNIIENRGGLKFNNALDLYCGFGNITLFLETWVNTVIGVEADDFSIELGRKNLKLNKIENIKFIKSDAKDFLEKANRENAEYEIVVLDPPRAGIKGLVPKIAKLNPSLVIYVSCDSMTLLRDMKVFAEFGFNADKINLIDMFPRTYHMEHIVFMKFCAGKI